MGRVAFEQELALEHGGERRRGLVEVGADVAAWIAEYANDDRAHRLAEPPHGMARTFDLPMSDSPLRPVIAALALARTCRDVVSTPRERMHSTRDPSTRCQTDASVATSR